MRTMKDVPNELVHAIHDGTAAECLKALDDIQSQVGTLLTSEDHWIEVNTPEGMVKANLDTVVALVQKYPELNKGFSTFKSMNSTLAAGLLNALTVRVLREPLRVAKVETSDDEPQLGEARLED